MVNSNTTGFPMHFEYNNTYVLETDENGYWITSGTPIKNLCLLDDESIFKRLKQSTPFLSQNNTGTNFRLIHLNLNYGQSFKSIYRPTSKRGILAKEVLALVKRSNSKKEDIISKLDELKEMIENDSPNELGE